MSCWNCIHFLSGGIYFPGRCNWFVINKKEENPKEIPVSIIDNGCKFFKEKHIPINIERITND